MRPCRVVAAIALWTLLGCQAASAQAATATATPTAGPPCAGDCDGDGRVTLVELMRCQAFDLANCAACDANGDGTIQIVEVVAVANNFAGGCPGAATPTATPSPLPPTPTDGPSPTFTAVATQTPTATVPPPGCIGDCNRNGLVTINELVRGVNIALGNLLVGQCASFDADGSGGVTIDEMVRAVAGALGMC